MIRLLKNLYNRWRTRLVNYHTTNEIVKTLEIAHAQELASTPGEEWPILKASHAAKIAAVKAGNVSITDQIDRRSWQWPYLPSSLSRVRQPIVKMTPYNLRRFAKSPIPRRAINLIKNAIISLDWEIVPTEGSLDNANDDVKERISAAKKSFSHPNGQDSYQSFMEMGIDDMLTFGAFVVEPQVTPDPAYPVKMWVVDSSTIRIYPTWREGDPSEPHYAQMTGLKGERGIVVFYDDELMYLRDNPSVESPFGLGKMEVAFQAVSSFLGVQEMSGRAGSDQIHKTWLWWSPAQSPSQVDVVRRHITNDLEGQSKVNLMSGMPKPEVIEIIPVSEADLLLNWQEFLIRIIADAFDLSPLALGLEKDINRSTGEVLDDKDFRSAVVPIAVKLAEGFTRFVLHRTLGWDDIKFEYKGLDDPDMQTKVQIQTQLYASNATTPNRILKSLGMPELATPFADLTQLEAIIANEEIMSTLQDSNAASSFGRQQTAQQQMMDMYQQQGQEPGQDGEQQGAGGSGLSITMPKLPGLKPPMMPKPKALTAPKISAPSIGKPAKKGKVSASEIVAMTLPELKRAMAAGTVPAQAKQVKQQVQQQPGALQKMSKELLDYLDQLEKLQDEKDDHNIFKPDAEDIEKQQKRFKKKQHRQSLLEKVVYNLDENGLPKTRTDQDMFKREPGKGKGKEIPNYVSDSRVSHKRPRRRNNVE